MGVYSFYPHVCFLRCILVCVILWDRHCFVDFKPYLGISGSEWVGLKHFKNILSDRNLLRLLYNTLKISVLRIIFAFPVPIIFALILNEVKTPWFKKMVQTVTCFPNFISWVVFAGIVFTFTGPTGVINQVLINMGKETVNLTTNPDAFIPLIIITDILKSFGWSSIIYMASISGVDLSYMRLRLWMVLADFARHGM